MAQPNNAPNPPGGNKLVIIAAVVGVLAVVMVNIYIAMIKRQVQQGEFAVYRLVTNLNPGDKLKESNVKAVAMPKKYRSSFEGMVIEDSPGDDDKLTALLNERVRSAAQRNQFLSHDLFADAHGTPLDTKISSNLRLIALPVNPKTLPGNLQPGMFVDIEALFPGGNLNILTVLERAEVFSVGTRSIAEESQASDRNQRRFTTISLQVTPEEATALEKIKKLVIGDFELHLRNPNDNSTPKIPDGGLNPAVLRLLEF